MNNKIQAFAKLLQKQAIEDYKKEWRKDKIKDWHFNERLAVKVIAGRKYTKVDVGTSGKYMVDQDGNIWGIKGYGKVHHGHNYGTLDTIDDWYWGGYTAVKRSGNNES